ncbi:shikimate kinase [Adhaeribacter aerolatus]|uniref:Shikimate kinase n=1 Tax=Adhaeribacter aerolatus TaxID=670289 RepID=A0A512AZF4_9BACT|nr:shikimate kinase [Adhaeribacter aerolatus]GEO05089.1 shikimate kinase [Adhaeribacter aerolatus]
MSRPIFLVGMPGAGKSTIGRKLAATLEVPFHDLDDYLEEKEGVPIREIFATRGEVYFRQAEASALRALTEEAPGSVIATGGGAPCFHGSMDFMNRQGTTVYLKVPVDVLLERLTGHGREHRPLVAGKSNEEVKEFLTVTLANRIQFYGAAHITYQNLTRERDVTDLCRLIARLETMC